MAERVTPPHERDGTRTTRYAWAVYITGSVVLLAATLEPSWAKWQAVLIAFGLGSCIGTATRDAWWRKEIKKWIASHG